MRFKCPVCLKVFKSQRTYRQHELRTRACPRTDGIPVDPVVMEEVDQQSPHPVVLQHVSNHGTQEPHLFGMETVEPMLSQLTPTQLASLVRYPEDALTQDLPNLLFFNLDHPMNQTISWTDSLCIYSLRSQRDTSSGGKWRRCGDMLAVLRVVARHMRKVIERERVECDVASCLEHGLAVEYLKAIDEGKDVLISEFCPYYDKVESATISIRRMVDRLQRTIHANCNLPTADWVRTEQYALENLDE